MRNLTVEHHLVKTKRFGPFKQFNAYSLIRLKGKWLTKAGFNPGTRVEVQTTENSIIITKI